MKAGRWWQRWFPALQPLPDPEARALARMTEAYRDLTKMGWAGAIYCPKDGTVFLSIEPGTAMPMRTVYHGEWPRGGWWELDSGDAYPVHPCLWKPLPPGE